ncbi:MAG: YraN family protein [Minisyncoccia bacterium]|jgi:putative endonuclease
MSDKTKELGNLAENLAGRYLESQGYEIIERNYRKPWGEIDIIVFKDDVCVFVEVKANSREFAGNFNPELRVDEKKLAKIIKTAELYMASEAVRTSHDWPPHSKVECGGWQVDVVSVTFIKSEHKAKIKHFKNVAEALF